MISVVLYGRNDAHGYNLHRRAALSLNCLAEALTHPEDEIVFVDYNTPDELPTFVEALADTLTERCRGLLRVLRIRAALHEARYRSRTHLPTVEAVARNAAVRRSNPANRWVLSTNPDMIFVPGSGSLSDLCSDLPDGFYGLPRFELPEWLWELLPRTDPQHVLAELRTLGPALRLDEHTLSDSWIRFDAPGDFQLVLRDDFVAIDGFNEEMLLGWHVDSNLSRRLKLRRGSIESLDERLAGYHCNHNRTPTIYHQAAAIGNDLDRFYLDLEGADLPGQRETWGLAGLELEEVSPAGAARRRLVDALVSTIAGAETPRITSSAMDWILARTYDSAHVLPFVADVVALAPPGSTIGYVGANAVLEQLLEKLVRELDGGLTVVTAGDEEAVDDVDRSADVLVVDFGLDSSTELDVSEAVMDGLDAYPAPLLAVLAAFQRIVESERARLVAGAHPRPFVLVNSATLYVDAYVKAHLDCSYTTPHSQIRRATVKRAPSEDAPPPAARQHAERLVSWAERDALPDRTLPLRVGQRLEIGATDAFSAFDGGWLFPERNAIWTRGTRAEVAFALDGIGTGAYLFTTFIGRVGAARDELLAVDLLINGSHVDSRLFPGGANASVWRVRVPEDAVATRVLNLRLDIREARVWSKDDRQLGLYVTGFMLQRDGLPRRLSDIVERLRPGA